MSILKYLIVFLFSFLWLACDDFLDFRVVENGNPRKAKFPIVTCFISPQDTVYKARFEAQSSFLSEADEDRKNFEAKMKATKVYLSDLKDSLLLVRQSNNDFTAKPNKNFKIKVGSTYQLSVFYPDGSISLARTTVPLDSVDYKTVKFQNVENKITSTNRLSYIVSWADPNPKTINHYSIESIGIDFNDKTGLIYNQGEYNTSFGEFNLIDGNSDKIYTKTLSSFIRSYGYADKPNHFRGNLINILLTDDNYYNYHKALENTPVDGSPFDEPKSFYNNFKGNTFGVFGSYNLTSFIKILSL